MGKIVALKQQISFDEAMRRIVRKHQHARSPYHSASYHLGEAIKCGYIRLYVDGSVVSPNFFAGMLYCWADQDQAGDWHTGIGARAALERPLHEYSWTLSLRDVREFVRNYDGVVTWLS
jgi:hypothetical protein